MKLFSELETGSVGNDDEGVHYLWIIEDTTT